MRWFRIRIRQKIVWSILLVVGVSLMLVIRFLFADVRTEYERIALELQASQVEGYAQRLSLPLNLALSSLQSLANELEGVMQGDALSRLNTFDEQAARLQNATPQFSAVWLKLDYRYLNSSHARFNGSALVGYYGQGDAARRVEELVDTAGFDLDEEYIALRDRMEVYTAGPRISQLEAEGNSVYTFTLGIPYRDKMKIPAGIVGAEVRTSFYETFVASLQVADGTHCVLLSPTMQVAAGLGRENVGNAVQEVFASIPSIQQYCDAMQRGESVQSSFTNRVTGEEGFFLSAPVWVGSSSAPWALCLISPKAVSMHSPTSAARFIILITLAGLLLIFLVLLVLTRSLGRPIGLTVRSLKALSYGTIDRGLRLDVRTRDEVEEIAHATNRLLTSLSEKSKFALAIGQGNLNVSFHAEQEDALGQSLLEMQRSLVAAKAREERQRDIDEQQAWVTRGIATFSDLLRVDATSIEDFSYSIVRELVHYTDMLVGAVYLKETDSQGGVTLRMTAMHAYNVRKFTNASFALGEGVVGRCAKEESLLVLTDLPDDYLSISSGLGEAKPDTLLLVPVLMNGVLLGVMEFACFGSLLDHHVGLIENVASSFASTLVTVQNSIQTKMLLREAQRRSEAMSAQEEVMRQNVEELHTIREESARQLALLDSLQRGVRSACHVVEYDPQGVLLNASVDYLGLLHLSPRVLGQMHHADVMGLNEEDRLANRAFWRDLSHGQVKCQIRNVVEVEGMRYTFVETYAPLVDVGGHVERVVLLAFDITNWLEVGDTARGA